MKIIRKFLNSEDKKRLFSNFISLSILQGANYLLPLITFPYLVRVLGVEKFGLLAFANAFIAYLNILVDYGFNLTATKEVSIHRDNKEKLSEIFSSIMIIKLILLVISFIILLLIVFNIEKFRKEYLVFIFSFGMVIGQALFPQWFFQGIEKMKYITFLNILAKIIFTIAIFVFINKSNDYTYVPLINSLGFIVAGILSLIIIFKNFKIKFRLPSIKILKHYLIDGWYIFISTFFGNFYRNFNALVLGILTSDLYVGYYSISERIIKIIQTLQNVVGNVLYPYLSKKFIFNKKLFFEYTQRYIKKIIFVYLTITILVFLLSSEIIYLIQGKYENPTITNLKIMSMVILIGGLNYYFANLGLLTLGYTKKFSKAIIYTGSFNIIISFILVYFFRDIGASLSLVLSELFLLLILIKYYSKLKKELFI